MPCPNKVLLKSYLAPEEFKRIAEQAKAAGLSLSSYVRAAVLMREIRSFEYQELRLELLRLRADLSRLGNLFKAELSDKPLNRHRLELLLGEINKRQTEIKEAVQGLCSAKESAASPATTTIGD